ncbi:MAG TPA: C4-dicarboxylate transporter DcuC [Isosphaeraceae bacterium]|nr:C4-dicarboxylate transporter DcuC [Isosphaeraceae bacterium]
MPTEAIAGVVVVGAVALLARGAEVRLVLGLAALGMFAAAGRVAELLGLLAAEMANARTIVPIASALGFAYALKRTGCDQHLVHLLVRPLRRARWLLVPGGVAASYLVNTAIVSQTGAAAAVGPILVPLLREAGVGPATAGATLLLGSSMGGELLNPGTVEVAKLAQLTGLSPAEVVRRGRVPNLLACGAALLAWWALSRRDIGKDESDREVREDLGGTRINPFRAAVPLIPIALLLVAERLRLPGVLASGTVQILAAMLVGVVAAGLASPSHAGRLAADFWDGAGYAYTHVISLIVTATVFAKGIEACGLVARLTSGLSRLPVPARVGAGIGAPWALATLSGTGIGSAIAVMTALVPAADSLGLDPVRLGVVSALGAHFGRTMSPVAAVTLFSAGLSGATAPALVKRVAPPLLVGGTVLFAATVFRLV